MECVWVPVGKGGMMIWRLVAYELNKQLQTTTKGSHTGWRFLLQKSELSLE